MLRKVIKRIKCSRSLKRLLALILLVCLYFSFIGLISEFVDQNSIERSLKDWIEESLNYSTYINIDHTDTALRSDWRTDLYIHELEIVSPRPEFILPVLSIDTVRASANLLSLFGGIKANPVIQLRDGILNIECDKNNRFNISGLESAIQQYVPNFISDINISSADFILMNCKLLLNYPDTTANILLNGNLILTDNIATLSGITASADFSYKENGLTKRFSSTIIINKVKIELDTRTILYSDIIVEDLPAFAFKLLKPDLPPLPSGLHFSGRALTGVNSFKLSGQLENLSLHSLPRYLDFNLSTNPDILTGTQSLLVKIDDNDTNLLTFSATKSKTNHWEALQLHVSQLDFDKVISDSKSYWIDYLISEFPAISMGVDSAIISGLNIGRATVNIVKNPSDEIDLSLDGTIAGGELTLLAKNISFTKDILPEKIMATLEIKDTANTLVSFSRNLPKILDCTPTSGYGELAVLYKRANINTPAQTRIQLKLNDVTVQSLSSGTAIASLAAIPERLNRLNKLCISPLKSESAETIDLINPISTISLDSVQVSYESDTDSRISATSRELGNISGELIKLDQDTLKFNLSITDLPDSTLTRSNLTRTSYNAYKDFTNNNPLRIELVSTKDSLSNKDIYIEEIYRNWLTRLATAQKDKGE